MAERRLFWLQVALIVAITAAAYARTFDVPFVFDDIPSIKDNPSIRRLWPLSGPLQPPDEFGYTVSGRPVLNLTLAINYAISGLEPWSYHAVNLVIHIGAALALFGLLRRLLASSSVPVRLRDLALPGAGVIAAWWAVHPLQTESVTYVIQRAESLMGLFYFLTVYGFVRFATEGGGRRWAVLSVAACLLGVGTKEVAATTPVTVLLLDRAFFSSGLRAAVRRRWGYYLALVLTWVPLAFLVFSAGGDRGGTYRWTPGAFVEYWLTQPEAWARYFKLTLWPHPLIFEYGLVTDTRPGAITAYLLVAGGFLFVAGWLWRRHKPAAVGLLLVPVVLSPTSIMPSTIQVIVEHRMYVPLAGLGAVMLGALVAWLGRRGIVAALALVLLASILTIRRNEVYRDSFELWTDTVQRRPTSAKAHNNLAHGHHLRGDLPAALRHYREAIRLEPEIPGMHFNLGLALQDGGLTDEAIASYREAIRQLEAFPQAHAQLGIVLAREGRREEAATHLQRAHAINPNIAETHLGMGILLSSGGRHDDAITMFRRALELAPGLADAHLGLGVALAQTGRFPEAVKVLRELAEAAPGMPEVHVNLGNALVETGDAAAAIESYRAAVALDPAYANAHYNLGNALLGLKRWPEARAAFEAALRADPDFKAAREMLERMRAAGLP